MKKVLTLILASVLAIPCFAQQDAGKVNVGHKIGHFTIGFGVAWGCGLANHHETGLAIGIGLGLAKEYVDNKSGETWVSQKRDILITSTGAILGYAIAKHYYPEGADLGRHAEASLWQQQQDDIRLQAEFKSWQLDHPTPSIR